MHGHYFFVPVNTNAYGVRAQVGLQVVVCIRSSGLLEVCGYLRMLSVDGQDKQVSHVNSCRGVDDLLAEQKIGVTEM